MAQASFRSYFIKEHHKMSILVKFMEAHFLFSQKVGCLDYLHLPDPKTVAPPPPDPPNEKVPLLPAAVPK